MLILTDHSGHSAENSLYVLARAMALHPQCNQLDIATRANPDNLAFFQGRASDALSVSSVGEDFAFDAKGKNFTRSLRDVSLREYDVVWLRLPPPLGLDFLEFLADAFPEQLFINDPKGIYKTGSKAFLLNFRDYCPPMQHCKSVEDIIKFKSRFPIVLKPLREYGGKGIVRVEEDQVWQGDQQFSFDAFIKQQRGSAPDYIGVKFLKNVSEGDKRIVVVNGTIIGASLRLPAEGSWLCNVAMGGRSRPAKVTSEEQAIIAGIHPKLTKLGIVMYGVDTLVDDQGRRVLSEINTTSIGGIAQIARQDDVSLVEKTVALIWDYINLIKETNNVIRN